MIRAPDPLEITAAAADLLQCLWPAAAGLPAAVQQRTQRLWLDTVSCACAGLRAGPTQAWLREAAIDDAGSVPLPGTPQRLGAGAAAMAMAIGACWDEACEGLALAHGRPGVPVVAALWPQVALHRPSWRALWQASAVGYEVAARLGARLRIKPGMHVDGVWGAFGAAAAVTHLRGGTWQQALQALEACAVQLPFSLYRPVQQGAHVRNLYLGHSAWLGLQAAQAVRACWDTTTGAIDDMATSALDGAAAGHWPLAGDWLILDSYWKPFAAVRHVHYGAMAALRWREHGMDPAAIDAIDLQVYPEALQYCGNRAPRSVLAAQFSLTFGVAAALRFGDLSPAEYRPPRFDDALLRRLESLLTLHPVARPDRGATLTIRAGGRSTTVEQGPVSGDPGHEPDDAAVRAKFDRYSQGDAALQRWAQRLTQDPPQAAACLPD